MPYKLLNEENGWFVFNTEKKKRMNKIPLTEGRAKSYMAKLYSLSGEEVENEKKELNRFMVFREKSTGRFRWISISSNSFQDLDGEIVSQEALENDVRRADKTKDFGVLRWWHVKGADLGSCDYNAMIGRMLVESGLFFNERVGEKMKESADDLQVSLGFFHPFDEPKDGVYYSIKRFERSILPKGKAANPFTSFSVKQKS